jgi:hypothetical protein
MAMAGYLIIYKSKPNNTEEIALAVEEKWQQEGWA